MHTKIKNLLLESEFFIEYNLFDAKDAASDDIPCTIYVTKFSLGEYYDVEDLEYIAVLHSGEILSMADIHDKYSHCIASIDNACVEEHFRLLKNK